MSFKIPLPGFDMKNSGSMSKLISFRQFIQEIIDIWISEKPNQLAASLAYFGMFSFSAIIYIAFLIASFFINETAAAERFYTRIETVFGSEISAFIKESVAAISSANIGGSVIVSVISLISLILVATGFFLQLKYVLNRIWGVPIVPRGQMFAFIWQRLFAFIMVIASGLLIILVTIVNVAFVWLGDIVEEYLGESNLLSALNLIGLMAVVILAIAFIYKFLPDVKVVWRDVWVGSVAAALLMTIGGLLIGLYFRLGGVHSAFEAAGAFAVLMIAIYCFAQIFLIGAIITKVFAKKYGSMHEST
jgi:membrane protein